MNPTLELRPPDMMHKNISDAIQARDVDAAVEAVTAHYRLTRERLFTFVEGEGPAPTATEGPVDSPSTPAKRPRRSKAGAG